MSKTPLKSIRSKCLDCSCDSIKEVDECEFKKCSLFSFRSGKLPNKKNNKILNSIRIKCLDCAYGSKQEVELCPSSDCSLFQYRLGHNESRSGLGCSKPQLSPPLNTKSGVL